MSSLGLYRAGSSPLHRLSAGAKLAGLVVAAAGSVLLDRPREVSVALVVVMAGYVVAGLSPRLALASLRPLLALAVCIGVLQVIVAGWARAYVVVGMIVALVLLAGLVTLTTRTTELVDVVVRICRPLRLVGVDPQRVGLLLALSIRTVPVVMALAEEVRDAQWARGLSASPRAFAVPLLVRSLRHADALGEALVARGADD
jgi:biotin transport system permease protein